MDDSTDLANIWSRAIGRFDESVRPNQRAWLSQTRPLGLVEDTAVIAAPNEWVKDYLENRLRPLIASALSEELGRDIQVAVTVQRSEETTDSGEQPDDDVDEDDDPLPMSSTMGGAWSTAAALADTFGEPSASRGNGNTNGSRHLGLSRPAGPCGEASQPRSAGRSLLHLVPHHGRTERHGPLLQRQQSRRSALPSLRLRHRGL